MGGVVLVGERDLLSSVASPGDGYQLLHRAGSQDPNLTAERLANASPEVAVVFAANAGELEAIREAGVRTLAWDKGRFPVADDLFGPTEPADGSQRVFFSGPTSERRDRFLQPVKHRFDVLHLAGGADLYQLRGLMDRCTIAIDFAREDGLPLVDRVGPAAAAGMLVLAERPLDRIGLEEGVSTVGFSDPDELELLISDAIREPDAFLGLRRTARAEAEGWRSSAVIPAALAGA